MTVSSNEFKLFRSYVHVTETMMGVHMYRFISISLLYILVKACKRLVWIRGAATTNIEGAIKLFLFRSYSVACVVGEDEGHGGDVRMGCVKHFGGRVVRMIDMQNGVHGAWCTWRMVHGVHGSDFLMHCA